MLASPIGSKLVMDDSEPKDALKHLHEMQQLAEELGCSVLDIKPAYEDIFETLRSKAVILDYLPVLISKHVKERIKKFSLNSSSSQI